MIRSSISILILWTFLQALQWVQLSHAQEIGDTKQNLRSSNLKNPSIIQNDYDLSSFSFQSVSSKATSILFPGMPAEDYLPNEPIQMFVELVESQKTQVPFEYYKLPVCKPTPSSLDIQNNNSKPKSYKIRSNLGQKLMGYSTQPVGYQINVLQNMGCTPLCHVKIASTPLKFLRRLVKTQYRIHFTLDSLPILMRSNNVNLNYAVRGIPLGFILNSSTSAQDGGTTTTTGDDTEELYLYNHLRFTIYYNTGDQSENSDAVRITGFEVHPVSIKHSLPNGLDDSPNLDTCRKDGGPVLNKEDSYLPLRTGSAGEDFNVVYSYEVEWKQSEVQWADRWDIYLMESPVNEIHYFAIVNSMMIAVFLTGTVAIIMIRALRKDIEQYNDYDELTSPTAEETGWKLVHADVFRPPIKGKSLLSAAVGTGMQIGTSILLTLLCASLRLLNPMKKGQTLSAIVFLYVFSGSVGGYTSAKLFKFFSGKAWKRTTFLTAVAFPGSLFSLFLCLNTILSFRDAASAVSFWTILNIFMLWLCVSAPLVFIGSYFGYKSDKISVPTKTNQIARFIPPSDSVFVKFPHSALVGGLLPFISVCLELHYIMGALWLHHIYYFMGFITVVFLILTLSTSMVSMTICYIQLCNEDYKWWWKSFYNCASIGLYLFLYSLWYLAAKLELVGFLPFVVYMLYMGFISFAFALYSGAVGLISSFWFCRKIYGAVKVD